MGVPGEYWGRGKGELAFLALACLVLLPCFSAERSLLARNSCLRERQRRECEGEDVLLCPNLFGSLEAPTTANWGEEKKARAAASVAILREAVIGLRRYGFGCE